MLRNLPISDNVDNVSFSSIGVILRGDQTLEKVAHPCYKPSETTSESLLQKLTWFGDQKQLGNDTRGHMSLTECTHNYSSIVAACREDEGVTGSIKEGDGHHSLEISMHASTFQLLPFL